jgi:hypothetical protein
MTADAAAAHRGLVLRQALALSLGAAVSLGVVLALAQRPLHPG